MMKASLFFMMTYNNFIGQVRQWKRNSMLFLIPICIFIFIHLFFTLNKVEETFIEPVNIGLILEDESIYGKMLANSLVDTEAFSNFAHISKGDLNKISKEFEDGNLDAMITMPKGFVDSVMGFERNPILVKINYKEPLKAIIIYNILMSYEKYISTVEVGIETLYNQMEELGFDKGVINSYNEEISYDLIFTTLSRERLFEKKEIVNIPSVSSAIYFFIAMVIMFLMYIGVYSTMNLIKEREDMCLVRLKNSKISMMNYLLSKAMGATFFMSTIVVSWLVLFLVFMGGEMSQSIMGICLFLFISIFFNVSVAMFYGSFMNSQEGIVLFSNVFIFINAIIGGSIIPIQMMPDALQKIAVFSPNYWMIRGFLYFQSGYNIKEGVIIGFIFFSLSWLLLLITSKKFEVIPK